MKCRFIELIVFTKSVFKMTFSSGWGSSLRLQKKCEANSAPTYLIVHLLVDFRIFLDVTRILTRIVTRIDVTRHILQTTKKKYCQQWLAEFLYRVFLSAINFGSMKYGRGSRCTFPSIISFTKFFNVLRKFSPVCPFDFSVKAFKMWGDMPPKPALEP